ncbi:MAG: type VI secretion system tip protein VgrG [Rhizobiaceae bacterium]|nr:type VI secretion system tip protein VgrG [Rhizobiaceae bacterium]
MADERVAVAHTPLGDSTLIFTHLAGRDEISRPFGYRVRFVSTDLKVDPLAMLGGIVSVELEADPKRWFTGHCAEFRQIRIEGKLAYYEAMVRPWFWFLSNTSDNRIFQNMTVVEIVEKIFSKYGIAKFEKRLQGSYKPREYCVQYSESDLDFVQRLLEHEGIFYFFEHGDGEHTMVLADAMSKLKPAPDYKTVVFNYGGGDSRRDREYLTEWASGSEVRPGAYAHTDYDFQKPGADLMAKSEQPFGHAEAKGEVYADPGVHLDTGRGDAIAAIRREELQATHQRIAAAGNVRGLFPGCTFSLEDHPRDDQNQDYLVVTAEYHLSDPAYRSGADPDGPTFRVVLGLSPTSLTYRPPRITPRPHMAGPQTAVVVGPSGEEIFTDKYARVKVQFYWDREGKKDQNSSCFVRVSQTWAGANWGFIQIPRIGQEVIVDFMEGDPDQPIITGRVYNDEQMPPYGLPGSATQSGWKSNSSLGGGGSNELRFEDKAGSEEVYFHAQKDHVLVIENDRTKTVHHDQSDRIDHDAKHSVGHNLDEDVGNDKTLSVGHDRTGTIGNDDTESVGNNRALSVGSNETISIGANSTETIGANHSQTVALNQSVTVGVARVDTVGATEARTVGAAQTISVGATRSVSVGADQSHRVGASDSVSVGAAQTIQIGANQSTSVGGDQTLSVAKKRSSSIGNDDSTAVSGAYALSVSKASSTNVEQDMTVKVGKKLMIDVADEVTIKCGSASIMMKKDGTIQVSGKDITIKGSGKININASSDVKIKGSTINNN